MLRQLEELSSLRVFPSRANFLYIELPANVPGRKLRDRLLQNHGLLVRECSNKIGSSERYLRLAVQTKEAVDLLTIALHRELSNYDRSFHNFST
jgi:threonine-phosphate decarboxylase